MISQFSRFIFIFILFGSVAISAVLGQGKEKTKDSVHVANSCPQKDIFDVLSKKKITAPEIPSQKVRAIILPIIGYSPATGLQIGAGSSLSWSMGHNPATKLSAGSVQLTWTTERQLIFQIRSNMHLDQNKWLMHSDWRWYIFRMPTYGLGTGPSDNIPGIEGEPKPASGKGINEGGRFSMKYNWIKFHNVLFREITSHIYAGIGYHLDNYYDIHDDELNTDSSNYKMTPHYAYCRLHGFNTDHYTASGLSINFAYDTRDNIINAYKGIFIKVNYRYNFEFLGSNKNGSQLWTEFRTYIGLSKKVPRNLLAFWVFGSFVVSGELPYLNLMSNGFDQMNSSGRGYAQGRWRGEDFVYGEMEYRFPISSCSGIIGGVIFANVTTASNQDMKIPLFGFFKPGCGFGLRIMVGKHDRTNILVDFGIGELSHAMYLQAQEVF